MRLPSFEELQEEIEENGFHTYSFATHIHPNPKFYKYYWWVFWKDSPIDNGFLDDKYRLCTAEAMKLMRNLRKKRESFWVYNRRIRRYDPENTPFNYIDSNQKIEELAPAFSKDNDPEWMGMK